MTVTATVSSREIRNAVRARFTGQRQFFRVALVNTQTTYVQGVTTDIEFMANEIEEGFGGYTSPAITYTNADIGIFADEGVPLARKAATFSHDNSVDAYDFTHVVLLRTDGIDASAAGTSLTVYEHDAEPDFTDEYNGWVLTGPNVPAGTGINAWTGTGGIDGPTFYSLNQGVPSIARNTNMMLSQIVAVTPLASTATLSDGNEAVFYFDIKHFTYYQV